MPAEPTMTVDEFAAKWRRVSAGETQAAQSHFNDLCAVLGVPNPIEGDPDGAAYAFEKGVTRRDGTAGQADVRKEGCFGWEYKGKNKNLAAAYEQLLSYREGLGNPPILVVSDMNRFEIHTNFTNAEHRVIEFTLKDMAENPFKFTKLLRDVFTNPEALRPDRDPRYITESAAAKFGEVAQALRDIEGEHRSDAVARFLNRLIFCFFAEGMRLFQDDDQRAHEPITTTLQNLRRRQERAKDRIRSLFEAMSDRDIPDYGPYPIPWFNGGLFDQSAVSEVFSLTADLVNTLLETAELDWTRIDPAIFGTLFERGLDPKRRSQMGAHYTDPDNVMRVVEPVILRPLRRELSELRASLEPEARAKEPAPPYGAHGSLELEEAAPDSPAGRIHAFHDRLAGVRVLDPACGSGNFLYVAMRELKQLEQELISWANEKFGINSLRRRIGPHNMLGIDIDQYAVDLTRMSLWIGHIQWTLQQSMQRLPEPILGQIKQIECRDALLDQDENGNPIPAQWPEAEFIVGNPPFLGGKRMRADLGADYIARLRTVYGGKIGGLADLCTYWHELARRQINKGETHSAGLLATSSITGKESRDVLRWICSSGAVFMAYRDEPWANDGAAVRIAIVCQDSGAETERTLDGIAVKSINADLTTGTDMSAAAELAENEDTAFRGTTRNGHFDLPAEEAKRMLNAPLNVHNRPNSDVIFPFIIARDLAQRPRGYYVIDFGQDTTEQEAACYEEPFEYVKEHVYPYRKEHRIEKLRTQWWRYESWRPGMRKAIASLTRMIATPVTSKHRFYVWLSPNVVPDATVNIIARDDDYTFGILHSRTHETWALARSSRLADGTNRRYVHTQCFNTFPFPWPLNTPENDLTDVQGWHRNEISTAAASLNQQREQWLNPPDVDPDELRRRTMTNLYNKRPTWLQNTHKAVDKAVFAAYEWPPDLSDEEILERLLALNHERAGQ